jgi:hypothetical protein
VRLELPSTAGRRPWVRPADQPLREREAPEHPAGALVGRRTACRTPMTGPGSSSSAGLPAHCPRRRRRSRPERVKRLLPPIGVAQPPGLRLQHAKSITVGRSRRNGSSWGPGSEAAEERLRPDVGDRDTARERGDLPKYSPRRAATARARRSRPPPRLRDDVERTAGDALPKHALARPGPPPRRCGRPPRARASAESAKSVSCQALDDAVGHTPEPTRVTQRLI